MAQIRSRAQGGATARRAWAGLAVALALVLAACGVPQGKYQAALAESSRSIKQVADERQRTEAAEKRAAELEVRLAASEQRNRDLASRLGERYAAAPTEAQADSAPREAAASPGSARADPLARSVEHQALSASLEEEVRAGRVRLLESGGQLTVRLAERVAFPTGSAVVTSDGRRVLRQVAEVFRIARGRTVRVEVHTDDIPIRTEAFPSNWELSSARAAAVVQALQGQGLNPALLSGTGFASAQPIASNQTSEGRAQNRRIEITLAPAATAAPDRAPARTPMIFPLDPSSGVAEPPPGG